MNHWHAIIYLAGTICACALQSAHAKDQVRTENGCIVFIDETPPSSVILRWQGPCNAQGLANGSGRLEASGGSMLPYSESGQMTDGSKVGTWLRNYESIGVELRYMYFIPDQAGVDVNRVANHTPAREKQAYAFMRKVVEQGDFASAQALGVSPPRQKSSTGEKSTSARACPSEVVRTHAVRSSTVAYSQEQRYRLISTSPLSYEETIRYLEYRSGTFDESLTQRRQHSANSLRPALDNDKGTLQHCRQTGACDSQSIADLENTINTLECWLAASKLNTPGLPAGESDVDTVTPQIPGCPRYLRKSFVEWSRKPNSNPQLSVWEVRNVSKRILTITFRRNGALEDLKNMNPGDSAEVWGLSKEPPYVVRDFEETFDFSRSQPKKKSLQCYLAIKPR